MNVRKMITIYFNHGVLVTLSPVETQDKDTERVDSDSGDAMCESSVTYINFVIWTWC